MRTSFDITLTTKLIIQIHKRKKINEKKCTAAHRFTKEKK